MTASKRYVGTLGLTTGECDIGKRIFADVINLKISRCEIILDCLGKSRIQGPVSLEETEEEKTGTEEEKATWRQGQRLEGRSQKPRNTWSREKLEEAKEDSLLEPSEGAQPPPRLWTHGLELGDCEFLSF